MTGTGATRAGHREERSGGADGGGKVIADRQPANDAGRAQNARDVPGRAALTWARAELRERIQQAGAALRLISPSADQQAPMGLTRAR